ncbi:MAG TPA: FkbM family methyltransferase [Conexivisphaerales archaeon]|nr:FkbM family methyltransferase [Conexivisphaerales archaeon]
MRLASLLTLTQLIVTTRNWSVALSDYLGRTKSQTIELVTRSGIPCLMRAKTTDLSIYLEVFVKKVYNPRGFEIHAGDVVVDVGAHIGVFTVFAASLAKSGRVYAFEPDNRNFEMLLTNVELNHLTNVVPSKVALAGSTGRRALYLAEDGGWSSFFKLEHLNGETETEALSLRDALALNKIERVDFLKMDCEGAEYEILFGCPDDTLSAVSRISMECHDMDNKLTTENMMLYLEGKGFSVRMVTDPENRRMHLVYASRTQIT